MSLYLKDSWISALRAGVRTHLRDVGRGWFNLQESDWEVYQASKLKKLIEMIKFNMQVSTAYSIWKTAFILTLHEAGQKSIVMNHNCKIYQISCACCL